MTRSTATRDDFYDMTAEQRRAFALAGGTVVDDHTSYIGKGERFCERRNAALEELERDIHEIMRDIRYYELESGGDVEDRLRNAGGLCAKLCDELAIASGRLVRESQMVRESQRN